MTWVLFRVGKRPDTWIIVSHPQAYLTVSIRLLVGEAEVQAQSALRAVIDKRVDGVVAHAVRLTCHHAQIPPTSRPNLHYIVHSIR